MNQPVKVLLADDHPSTRAGVRFALQAAGMVVCAEVGDAPSAVAAAERERPDLCLLHIHMPGGKIENLWRGPATLVEFYSLIAQDARTLMRKALEQGNPTEVWKLKPMDAIHLASARRIEADEFHTYDSKLFKFESMTGLRICEPAAMQRQLPGVE